MKILYSTPDYRYDVQSLCLLFYPRESFKEDDPGDRRLTVRLTEEGAEAVYETEGKRFQTFSCFRKEIFDFERTAVKTAIFDALCQATGRSSPWGILTGIRPALYYEKLRVHYGEDAERILKEVFRLTDEKIRLCRQVLEGRRLAVEKNTEDSASLYLSVPFCPSRCSYCSFVSAVTGRDGKLIPDYLEKLLLEAEKLAERIREDGKILRSVYVGGGTPSVLSPEQIEKLLGAVDRLFLSRYPVEEFTFEAGRPDTITEEKFRVLENGGVTRVSINPQTLSQSVLDAVGRKHTVEQFFRAYETASRFRFDKNVDLIAGLPTDTEEGFRRSLDGITALRPECLTVHTLYLKRAADFGQTERAAEIAAEADSRVIAAMLGYTQETAGKTGYRPYYLYRQKNTMGNGENIGYSLEGHECLYNIWMMDDLQQVYGLGAGAVTKIVSKEKITREGNTKLPLEYLKGE